MLNFAPSDRAQGGKRWGSMAVPDTEFPQTLAHSQLSSTRSGVAKRGLDLLVAAVALVVLFPAFVAIAAAICLDSAGGPFYSDVRRGYQGRPFRMWKFRTMHGEARNMKASLLECNDAEDPLFKLRCDPRVTPVGRFLRRWSLDELPQFINVACGQMSLIGPRPFLLAEADSLGARARSRSAMRPGISGPWQIGGRSDLAIDELIRLDLEYVQSWTFWRDTCLIAQTVCVLLSGKGAY